MEKILDIVEAIANEKGLTSEAVKEAALSVDKRAIHS